MNRLMRVAIVLGIFSIVAYLALLSILKNQRIADEDVHMPAILGIARGDWTEARALPMLPLYHWLAAWTIPICGDGVLGPRVVTTLFSLLGVAAFAALLRSRAVMNVNSATPTADALLQFAWNPLWFPFTALVYTDAPTTAMVMGAIWLHSRGARIRSALGMCAAVLLRQTALLWSAWLILRDALLIRQDARIRGESTVVEMMRMWFKRAWSQVLLLAAAAATILIFGRLTFGRPEWNRVGFSPAQLYLFALCIAMMWLPLIAPRTIAVWRQIGISYLSRPVGMAALLAIFAFLVLNYRSTHGWNSDLWYVRNWPLEAMTHSLAWRIALVGVIVLATPAFAELIRHQSTRDELLLVLGISIAFVATQDLAEPRYYIVPTMLMNLLLSTSREEARIMTIWYALLSGAIAAYTLIVGCLGGGVW